MTLFPRYATEIEALDDNALASSRPLPASLRLCGQGPLETFYAPFDHVNENARIVIVGITPGRQQAVNALRAARDTLRAGADEATAAAVAKQTASFSGPMRKNLVEMLDFFQLHRWLNIESCARLFDDRNDLAHFTSMLRYPVFHKTRDYNGTPVALGHPFLKEQLRYFLDEAKRLPDAVFVPLGGKVTEVLRWCAANGSISDQRLLDGLQHPSGANNERISYLLGKKPAEALSSRTNASAIDNAKMSLTRKIHQLLPA